MCELTKKCKSCLEEKLQGDFYKNSAYEDNLDYRCKECFTAKRKSKDNVVLFEMYKICTSCKKSKDLGLFSRKRTSKDGYASRCKECTKNKIHVSATYTAECKQCSSCKISKLNKEFNKSSKNKCGYTSHCKLCIKERTEDYNNREDIKIKKQMCAKAWVKDNYQYSRDMVNKWRNNRRETDVFYKLKSNLSSLLSVKLTIKGEDKLKNFDSTLMCTLEEFKKHIEKQFLNWMTWENYGNACETLTYNCSWDLDHIIPTSYAKTEEEVYLLNHWSNFQPLCSKVNRIDKKDNIYPLTNLELKITI